MKRRAKERQEKREDGQPIQRGYVLPFCGRSGGSTEKNDLCEESARGNWDSREGQQAFRLNPNWVGDRTTTLRRLLIGA